MTTHEPIHSAKWEHEHELHQKHEVMGLWAFIIGVILLAAALAWAEGNGFFQSLADGGAPAWPVGWP
jgi:hypothetical protein